MARLAAPFREIRRREERDSESFGEKRFFARQSNLLDLCEEGGGDQFPRVANCIKGHKSGNHETEFSLACKHSEILFTFCHVSILGATE